MLRDEELLGSFTGGIGYSLTTDENGNLQFEVTDFDPVPEPGTITLLALGLGAGLGVRRRRSRRRAA